MNSSRTADSTQNVINRLMGGLLPATPVPFSANGKLHEAGHLSYLRYLTTQPIAGVAVWAHTGRGLLLDQDTAQRVLRDCREALPNKVVIAGAGSRDSSPDHAETSAMRMAESAARFGADALLAYPPTWLRGDTQKDGAIVEYHRRLAAVGLPVIIFYLYENAGGLRYSPVVLDDLLAMPEVVGIKVATLDSVMTYQDVSRQMRERHPEKLFITGEDRFLGYSLQRGAGAALIGMGAICCELQTDLIQAYTGNNSARFLALSDVVDALAETIFVEPMEGYITRLLWALVHLGVIPAEAAVDPWGPNLPADEFEKVGRTLNALALVTQEC